MTEANFPLKELLTSERINKAFEQTEKEIRPKEGKLIHISPDHHTTALNFIKDSFFKDEVVSKAVGLTWDSEIEAVMTSILDENLSVMLFNEDSSEVMGIRIMKYSKHDDTINPDDFSDGTVKKLIKFYEYVDQQFDTFAHYNIKEIIHFFGLGVAEKYRRRGFGEFLVAASLNFLRHLEIFPLYLKVEGNSNFSKRIFDKLGFDMLAEIMYDSYKEDGEILIKDTGDQRSTILYGMQLNKA